MIAPRRRSRAQLLPTPAASAAPSAEHHPFASFFVQDIAFLEVKAATLTNGSVAACWTVSRAAAARYTVRCRLLTAAGKPTGREIVPTTAAGSQMSPEVIALPNGRFTVTWAQQDGAFPSAVKYGTYVSKGKPVTPERIGVALTGVTSRR